MKHNEKNNELIKVLRGRKMTRAELRKMQWINTKNI